MTTATMSVPQPTAMPTLNKVTFALLVGFVASLQISIAAANILLVLILVVRLYLLLLRNKKVTQRLSN